MGEEGEGDTPRLHPIPISGVSRNRYSNGTRAIHNNYEIFDPSVAKMSINIIGLFPSISHHNALELHKIVVNSAVYYTNNHLIKQRKTLHSVEFDDYFLLRAFGASIYIQSLVNYFLYSGISIFFAIKEFDTPIFFAFKEFKKIFCRVRT